MEAKLKNKPEVKGNLGEGIKKLNLRTDVESNLFLLLAAPIQSCMSVSREMPIAFYGYSMLFEQFRLSVQQFNFAFCRILNMFFLLQLLFLVQ